MAQRTMKGGTLQRFWLMVAIIVVLRAADLVLTFLYTPDLRSEWNVVVSTFRAAWTGMLVTQVVVLGLISVLMYFYYVYGRMIAAPHGLNFNQYAYYYFYGKLNKGLKMVFSIPANIHGLLSFNGYVLMVMTIGISIFAIIHNSLLLAHIEKYEHFVFIHSTFYFFSVFIGMAIVVIYGHLIRCYLEYKKQCR